MRVANLEKELAMMRAEVIEMRVKSQTHNHFVRTATEQLGKDWRS